MKQIRGHLGDKFDLFFQSDVDQTVSLDPLDLVHGPESIHYDSLFTSKSLVDASLPKDARESHISAFLSNLVAHVDATAEMKLHFRSKWPFPILVHLREDRKIVSDTPQSTILLQVENFPQMILDVAGDEDEDEGTRKRMLLQAVGLARLGNALRAPESKEPFVVTAIYIHKNFSATRHIVYQPIINREHVLYTEAKFNLRDPLSAFEFVFQLYNLVGQVRSQGRSLSNVDTRMKNTVDEIRCHYDPTMTEYRQKSPGESEEGEEGSRKRKVPKKRDEDDMSEDEMEDIIEDAGFTIRTDVIKEKWGTMRVMPVSYHGSSSSAWMALY
ncbi:hypothetical protein FRC18_003457 [Serendipita sp. 400]|nr:hypothetical protein FRC18_003457 [Serendipita sp. 400]